jgi:hypothetical protein
VYTIISVEGIYIKRVVSKKDKAVPYLKSEN